MKYSPIVIFAYHRIEHLKKTIESLKNNFLSESSTLIIYSDGPKSEGDVDGVNKVRHYLGSLNDGFKDIIIRHREQNFGLSNSVISGVTEVLENYDSIIVLEDDLVTSPHFLDYMNKALELYQDQEDVISIHGYNYPIKRDFPETFFLKGADCWGWATWKRGWKLFDSDGKKLYDLITENEDTIRDFNFYNSYPYLQMLKDQIEGKNNSWAIRWYASAYLNNKYTLYPAKSLVKNIGMDGTGTHFTSRPLFNFKDNNALTSKIRLIKIDDVKEDKEGKKLIADYLSRSNKSYAKKMKESFLKLFRSTI